MSKPNRADIARRWVTPAVARLFRAEIRNEAAGGISPSTLSSTVDSVSQGGADTFDLTADDVVALLMIRDLLPGSTRVADLLDN